MIAPPRRFARPLTFLACASLASMALAGCGADPSKVAVYPVSGTVVASGKPCARAFVVFRPSKASKPASGGGDEVGSLVAQTDESGHYTLSTYLADDGAPAGDYTVAIRPGAGEAPEVEGSDGLPDRTKPAAPTASALKYAKLETTPLKATVQPGENHLDFTLE